MATYALIQGGVRRLEDGANIPDDSGNLLWIEYQQWLAAGNTVAPLAPGPQYDWNGTAWVVNAARQAKIDAAARLAADLAIIRANADVITLLNMTPAQIDAYVDTNFPGATPPFPKLRDVLKVLAKVAAGTARSAIASAQ